VQTLNRPVFFFAGGGTGGHCYPALAIAQRLHELLPQSEIHFAGTRYGIESRIVPEHGYPLHLLSVRGFARNKFWINISVPFRLIASLWQSKRLLEKYQPSVVIGTGGYVSGPFLFMAHAMGYPTLIQEQNSYPGVTTRILARFVDEIHVSFQSSEGHFKLGDKIHLTGNPVRSMAVAESVQECRTGFGLAADKPTVLVFGGSQGARIINQTMMAILQPLLAQTDAQILWAAGRWNLAQVQQAAAPHGNRVKVLEYITEMARAYRAADLAVCRAGALTLAELAQAGLPAILIPFAQAAANHQEANALALQEQKAALVILERELVPERVLQKIVTVLQDNPLRKQMGEASQRTAFKDASEQLAQAVIRMSKTRGIW
jgi:UDP-N-acetylglucosamine--N-acetylmuramyl-(pentapeptide) pyrophosphoryl-undecaprenol N-acetylglucosamine transferase